ncbi:MAG: COX15/CtaA family protein [Thermoguttaceae bacterium]|nr:COX15/CtaA family protein [Thermoguttaceae bacterium]MDW8079023.1 hypothetical protein [Thermoguttaceae bacterium]
MESCQQGKGLTSSWELEDKIGYLLWVLTWTAAFLGTLIASLGAGLAIPDWPTNFAYPPFLLPPGRWLPFVSNSPWEIALAYLHRLAGWSAIVLAVGFAIARWRTLPTWQGRCFLLLMPTMLVVQASLGGLRVLTQSAGSAQLLAGTAPLVLAAVWAGVFLSRSIKLVPPSWAIGCPSRFRVAPVIFALWIYLQTVFGTQVRHASPAGSPFWFNFWAWVHLLSGLGLGVVAIWLGGLLSPRSANRKDDAYTCRLRVLGSIVLLQMAMGAATWLSRFGVPWWFIDWFANWQLALQGVARFPIILTTLHAFLGLVGVVLAFSSCTIPVVKEVNTRCRHWTTWVVDESKRLPLTTVLAGCGAFLAGLAASFPRHIPLEVLVGGLAAVFIWLTGLLILRENLAVFINQAIGAWPFLSETHRELCRSLLGALFWAGSTAAFCGLSGGSSLSVWVGSCAALTAGIGGKLLRPTADQRAMIAGLAAVVAALMHPSPKLGELIVTLILVMSWHEVFRRLELILEQKLIISSSPRHVSADKRAKGSSLFPLVVGCALFAAIGLLSAAGAKHWRVGPLLLALSAASCPLLVATATIGGGRWSGELLPGLAKIHGIVFHAALFLRYLPE